MKILLAFALTVALAAPGLAQKKKQLPPKDGTEFKLSPAAPKWVTCDVEFRDPAEQAWPNFFYGKPSAAGSFTWNAAGPKGGFAFTADKMAQKSGDQDRKVLAPLLADGKIPAVAFALKTCGAVTQEKDAKGKPFDVFPVTGDLTVGGKTVAVRGKGTTKFGYPKDAEYPDHVQLTLTFEVKGADLGVSVPTVQVRAAAVAYTELPKK